MEKIIFLFVAYVAVYYSLYDLIIRYEVEKIAVKKIKTKKAKIYLSPKVFYCKDVIVEDTKIRSGILIPFPRINIGVRRSRWQ